MKVDVLTIFPAIVQAGLDESILRIARENGLLDAMVHDPREFTWDTHRSVDDRPYGGGPGMVMKPEPLVLCAEKVRKERGEGRVIVMTPSGRTFNQQVAREYAEEEHLVLLCGRYEGIDQRVVDILGAEELSIGDFVLSGGEVPALAVIEAVTRLLPGALGHEDSTVEESFEEGLLEYPQYTRPPDFRGHRVPDILLSGDHARIAAWRRERAEERTRSRRDESDAPGAAESDAPRDGQEEE